MMHIDALLHDIFDHYFISSHIGLKDRIETVFSSTDTVDLSRLEVGFRAEDTVIVDIVQSKLKILIFLEFALISSHQIFSHCHRVIITAGSPDIKSGHIHML